MSRIRVSLFTILIALQGNEWLMGDLGDLDIGWKFEGGPGGGWVLADQTLEPLEAVYLLANENTEMGLVWDSSPVGVTLQREVFEGYNLIGLGAHDSFVPTDSVLDGLEWLSLNSINESFGYEVHPDGRPDDLVRPPPRGPPSD